MIANETRLVATDSILPWLSVHETEFQNGGEVWKLERIEPRCQVLGQGVSRKVRGETIQAIARVSSNPTGFLGFRVLINPTSDC